MKEMIKYGFGDFFQKELLSLNNDGVKLDVARVTEVQRSRYGLMTLHGQKYGSLKGVLFYGNPQAEMPAVGDFVLVEHNPHGDDLICHVFERKSKFSRLDTFYGTEQLVATNVDNVLIMTSMNKDFNSKKLERYVAIAWESGASPIVVLTKADLTDQEEEYLELVAAAAPFVPAVPISAYTGQGLEELRTYLKPGTTSVFLGSSGVGKSTLVNALFQENIMDTGDIRDDDSKGRHTTTYRELFFLPNGAMIIDTPGMREIGLWDAGDGLSTAFEEIETLAKACKFNDCKHKKEPGCAVKEAIKKGDLAQSRLDNYEKLKREAAYAARKEAAKERKRSQGKSKTYEKLKQVSARNN